MNTIYDDILTFEHLYESSVKCAKNVGWKSSTAHYVLNGLKETYKLHTSLVDGTYRERSHKKFKVYEPKEREVLSIAFRDRVYQRTLNDLAIYPTMAKSFIYDNCACQKGKGTDFARQRLKEHIRRYFVENKSNDGYIIHIDVKKYYPNMSHEVSERLFERKLRPDVYEKVIEILQVYEGDKGYFPGSQLIQILGISILSDLDHFIKERLRVKHYVRYMDDLILVVKDNPNYYLRTIESELNKVRFELNEKKTKVCKLKRGDTFLGFHFSLGSTGKIYMCLSKENIKRRRRKIKKIVPRQTEAEAIQSYTTWRQYAERSTNKAFLKETDKLFRRILYESKNQK